MSDSQTQPMLVPKRFCLGCDYCLLGLPSDVCPECGRPFDADDPDTFYRGYEGQPMTAIARRLYKRPSKLLRGVSILAVVGGFWAAGLPGGVELDVDLVIRVAWLMIALAWCVRSRLFSFVAERYGAPDWTRADRRRWLTMPGLLIATWLLSWTPVPVCVNFFVSLPEMSSKVSQIRQIPDATRLPDEMIGVFPATDMRTLLGGYLFRVKGASERSGFAYLPGRVPTGSVEPSFHHLFGNWYYWINESSRRSYWDMLRHWLGLYPREL